MSPTSPRGFANWLLRLPFLGKTLLTRAIRYGVMASWEKVRQITRARGIYRTGHYYNSWHARVVGKRGILWNQALYAGSVEARHHVLENAMPALTQAFRRGSRRILYGLA